MSAPGPLRLVPPDPDPKDFPPRAYACDQRDHPRFSPCPWCDVAVCAYGMTNAATEKGEGKP